MQRRAETAEPRAVPGSDDLVLEVPPDPAHVRTARLFAAAAARHFGVDEERIEDLKIAISEACTNAMKAHVQAGVPHAVRVVASAGPAGARFDVIDAGLGFDPRGSAGLDDTATPPSGLFEGSLGLTVINALFPSATMARNPVSGMTVSILVVPSAAADRDAAISS